MSEPILTDVFLNEEPLGLAEGLEDLEPFSVVIQSADESPPGSVVYFGADLPIGDIGEVKGRVLECRATDDGFLIFLEILAVDNRFVGILTKFLQGQKTAGPEEGRSPEWAMGIKQTNGLYATLVNCPAGLLTADQLAKIVELSRAGAGLVKLTHAQRVILLLNPDQVESVARELEAVGLRIGVLHSGIRNIRACCGALCRWSQGTDAIKLALELDRALYGRPMKFDVKIAISDCLRNCSESYCVDIGLIANRGKYIVHVGGVASSTQLRGMKLVEKVDFSEVAGLVERVLDWYDQNALEGERFYKTLERIGAPAAAVRPTEVFAQVSAAFDGLDMGMDMAEQLNRRLTIALAVKGMRDDLGLS